MAFKCISYSVMLCLAEQGGRLSVEGPGLEGKQGWGTGMQMRSPTAQVTGAAVGVEGTEKS